MDVVFKSIFRDEIASFMDVVKLSVVDHKAYRRTLIDFDAFLYAEKLTEKKLDAAQISRWLDGFDVHILTKKSKLSHIRRFSIFLATHGIPVSLPEMPRGKSDFTPYVYTQDEMTQIFELADDFIITNPKSRVAAELPMLLRILYGCGLRLGEALSMTWGDVNLEEGIITIKVAKNQKQRLVPMSSELTRILRLYRALPHFETDDQGFVFRQDNGQPRSNNTFWDIFNRILCELGIKNPQTAKYRSRGPCIHSLRHTFTLQSFLKADAEGTSFMETVPFLSTYLGHDGLMQTDIYLKARHELYTQAHKVIADYTFDVFPEEV
jgi:integrase